ncbi:hypothetical protein HMPREF9442_03132 [Paraprevotella xylaniphila YIT 11841]|uniref:Uncharacterized protein n=1 Tax=Paraprevotella xylaniphila YIT 11841 TaxID=762982 RepID=F3QY41_9BACT|nr:hypothetical protein HMPREF9442_03132 [Paraprevotella xylaniphila YIT 11841]
MEVIPRPIFMYALHHNFHKTSYFSVSKSNPLIHNRTRNKNQSPQNGKSFCGD